MCQTYMGDHAYNRGNLQVGQAFDPEQVNNDLESARVSGFIRMHVQSCSYDV